MILLINAELALSSPAQLAAMRDDERAKIRRCARLAGLALGAGNERLRKAMGHAAQAHGTAVRQLDDEIARRACSAR
jgi:hypothetical protein